MEKKKILELALRRLSELVSRRAMLVCSGIDVTRTDADIRVTKMMIDEIVGDYSKIAKTISRARETGMAVLDRRYEDGIKYLLSVEQHNVRLRTNKAHCIVVSL